MNELEANIPPDCFQMEAIETFQSFEGAVLEGVNYYVWLHYDGDGGAHFRFLYALQLVFGPEQALLLSSGEDSSHIQVLTSADLIETAKRLRELHVKAVMQVIPASAQALWQDLIGQPLDGVRLSKNETGLYLNDALQLDFPKGKIGVRINLDGEGLVLLR
jgi:hypothetical protein